SLDDPYSHYLTPKEAGEFHDSVSGSFDGVGMSVEQDPAGLKILTVFEDSPAKAAGLRRGNLITAVDGKSIAGMSSDLATARIKGEPGTTVTLEVRADGPKSEPKSITLTRKRVKVPVVRG